MVRLSSTVEGAQYFEGCSVLWEDIISSLGMFCTVRRDTILSVEMRPKQLVDSLHSTLLNKFLFSHIRVSIILPELLRFLSRCLSISENIK